MNLLDYIDKNATNSVSFYPNIPEDKEANAIRSICPDLSVNDKILILIDDSFLESGDVGIVVTHRYIYFKKRFRDTIKYDLKNVKECFVKKHFIDDSEIFINDEMVFTFDTASKGSVEKVFKGLNAYVKALQSQPQDAQSESVNLFDFISKNGLKGVFIKPNIPQEAITLALTRMCPELKPDDILIFISGKGYNLSQNIVIANEYLYIGENKCEYMNGKKLGEKFCKKIAIKDIKQCSTNFGNLFEVGCDVEWLQILINGEGVALIEVPVGPRGVGYDTSSTSRLMAEVRGDVTFEVDLDSIEQILEQFNNYIQALRRTMPQGTDDEIEEKKIPPLNGILPNYSEWSFVNRLDRIISGFGNQVPAVPRALIRITFMIFYGGVPFELRNDVAIREYLIFASTLLYNAMIKNGKEEEIALYEIEMAMDYIEGQFIQQQRTAAHNFMNPREDLPFGTKF